MTKFKTWQQPLTMRKKLIFVFVIMVLTPLVILAWLNNRATHAALTSAANQTMYAAASESVTALDTFIHTNIGTVYAIAQLPQIVEYVRLPAGERLGMKNIRDIFTTLKNNNADTLTYIILDENGKIIVVGYGSGEFGIGFDKSEHDYFKIPFANGKPFISSVQFLSDEQPVLYFSTPIEDVVGNIIGVLVQVYDATVLQDLIKHNKGLSGENAFVALVDENQFYLAHSSRPENMFKFVHNVDDDTLLQLYQNERIPDLEDKALFLDDSTLKQKLIESTNKSHFSIADITPDGKVHQATVANLRMLPWSVVFFQPQDVFLEPVYEQTQTAIIVAVVIIAITIGIAIIITGFLVGPIVRLTSIAQQVGKGNLSVQAHVESGDEIGILAATFNKMINRLEARISDLTHTQEELRQSKQELEVKNKRLKEMDKLKDEFLANTSHELRTPINGIIGLTESMLDGATGRLTSVQSRNLSMVVMSGRRLSTLINDILDFSKLKHHALTLQIKPIYLYPLVDIVLALSEPLVISRPIELINDIDPDIPAVYGDENRVQQILYNLIGNAIKFTEVGKITVSTVVGEEYLTVVIEDTGIGISDENLPLIFQAFEQADGSIARKYGGAGLGLALTKQLVALHGGEIHVDSQVGKGSKFYFTLPISKGLSVDSNTFFDHQYEKETVASILINDDEVMIEHKTLAPVEGEFHILVVDDEPVNLQVLINHLSLQNYHVTAAANGLKALDLIKNGQLFDIVVLDVMMPRMSGYSVCKEIRRHYSAIELPIILLTAKNQVGDLVTGFNLGANDYLVKPFSKLELLARIKSHLQLNDMRRLNASKDRFFSIVAHDLKGPFQPLLGLTELFPLIIKNNASEDELIETANTVHASAQNVYNLLENLLKWSRLQRGHMSYEPAKLNLHEIVQQAVTLLTGNAMDKNITLQNAVPKGMFVYADENMLYTVIRNLTTNALKFTPKKGWITIKAIMLKNMGNSSDKSVFHKEFVEVWVIDTGIGMTQEVMDKLFKIDVHHSTVGTNKEQGTGLGLIICQEMVKKNDGEIWVESEPGDGTIVKFTVPFDRSSQQDTTVSSHDDMTEKHTNMIKDDNEEKTKTCILPPDEEYNN
ncbi:MAG: hypothetical protein B6242_00110 [Anaerolineaceae bacterium 4572_78]|nr:MAG: hypothetical protein B6242_00110 [Anaerolineaceae bacterium 4572_78]